MIAIAPSAATAPRAQRGCTIPCPKVDRGRLKRYLARELYRTLVNPSASDLQPATGDSAPPSAHLDP